MNLLRLTNDPIRDVAFAKVSATRSTSQPGSSAKVGLSPRHYRAQMAKA